MDQEDLRELAERLGRAERRETGEASSGSANLRSASDPRLDVDALVAVMEGAESSGSGGDRLEALKAWREALVDRHDLVRRLAAAEASTAPTPLVVSSLTAMDEVKGFPPRLGLPWDAELSLEPLTRASNHAEVGVLPEFRHYGPLGRWLARSTARIVLFLSRFLTNRQNVVNGLLVDYAAESGDRLNRQQTRLDQLTERVESAFEQQRVDVTERLTELQAMEQNLAHRLHEVQTSLHQADRLGLDHELRLTETECDRAWSRVTDMDHREELRTIRRKLDVLRSRLDAQGHRLENQRRQAEEHQSALAGQREQVERQGLDVARQGESLARQSERLDRQTFRVDGQERAARDLVEVAPRVDEVEEGLTRLESSVLADIERLAAELAAGPIGHDGIGDASSGHLAGTHEGLYMNLEDEFRGPRSLVRERLAAYMPLLAQIGAGSIDRPILDLGCGRGEWLELLAEKNLHARGVEINSVAVGNCRSLGLDVTAEDGLEYLREQASGSLGMVTGFHLLEHLPFEYSLDLLGEALRVLRPGGVALFETPNPENLLVSSHSFHIDPTHRQPLVPELLVFLMRQQGFSRLRIERQTVARPDERLEPLAEGLPLAERFNEVIELLNRHFAAPSDFAVIGHKPQ